MHFFPNLAVGGLLYFVGEIIFIEPECCPLSSYDLRNATSLLLGGILAGLVFYFALRGTGFYPNSRNA